MESKDFKRLRPAVVFSWMSVYLLLLCSIQTTSAANQPNCSFPAVYGFGDSLTDVGNSIAAFPEQFAIAEEEPQGVEFPTGYPADRLCDGKLLIDFLAFGVRRRMIYPVLRGIAPDFTYGVCFAAVGGTARNVTTWKSGSGLHSPFSLNVQMQWLSRYKVRLGFYENQNPVVVVQSLPTLQSLNSSLYVVYAGYQDYFLSLYDQTLTPRQTLDIVDSVVQNIAHIAIEGIVAFGGQNILVVNLPPMGCIPAMLTLYSSSSAKYDNHGCLSDLNRITSAHNELLGQRVESLRTKYPAVKLYYGDLHGVYTDILKHPSRYNITMPLKACCGVGGNYNFNKEVTCGYKGMVGNQFVNLTSNPCKNPKEHISWDGIHTSHAFNKAAATAFFTAKHITPQGGFNCSADFSQFDEKKAGT